MFTRMTLNFIVCLLFLASKDHTISYPTLQPPLSISFHFQFEPLPSFFIISSQGPSQGYFSTWIPLHRCCYKLISTYPSDSVQCNLLSYTTSTILLRTLWKKSLTLNFSSLTTDIIFCWFEISILELKTFSNILIGHVPAPCRITEQMKLT